MKIFSPNAIIFSFLFLLAGCFNEPKKEENQRAVEINPGELRINYYSNKTVTPLEIPPDLTSPNYQKSFRLSEYTKTKIKQDIVNFSDKEIPIDEKIVNKIGNIEVKKSGNRRWLSVNKNSEDVWNLVREFFKEEGFIINFSNKKIGIMETDYLENKPEIPEQSVGLIRSLFQKALKARYSLPIIDKYRARIEPAFDTNYTNIYISLSSMQEVVTKSGQDDENTIWQAREKDIAFEVEMLYKLMLYLGGDKVISREKILLAKEEDKILTEIVTGFNGYSKMIFEASLLDSWDNFSWALDQLDVEIEDKDILEKAFYVKMVRTSDMGFFTRVFGDEAVKKTFRVSLKVINDNKTEAIFYDISGENEIETKEFSKDFFINIQKQFSK